MSAVAPQQSKPASKRTLLIIFAVTLMPFVLSAALYYGGWRPNAGSTSHGELVQPPRPVVDVPLQTLDGKQIKFSDFHKKWSMIFFTASACPEQCLQGIFAMRQIHVAQDKEVERLQRVLILTDAAEAATLQQKLHDYPGMQVVVGPAESVAKLTEQFTLSGGQFDSNRIYLVDPMGTLMMSQKLDSEAKAMSGFLKDITHLLKYSWIG